MENDQGVLFGTLDSDGVLTNERVISQADITACKFVIMVPEHYREDGSCRCNDPEHQVMMIREWGYSQEDFDGDFS